MNRQNMSRWIRVFIILVLAISVPWIVYWFGYVQHKVAAGRQQAYTTLSAVTAEIRDRLIAYDKIASNAGKHAERGPKPLVDYLSSILKITLQDPATPIVGPSGRLAIDAQQDGLTLNIGSPCDSQACLKVIVPVEHLVPWKMVETEFDGMLVLDKNGALLGQDRRLPAQPRGIGVPLQVGGKPANFAAIFAGRERQPVPDKPAKADHGVASSAGFRSTLFDFPDEAAIELAGVSYVAFMQVLSAPVTPTAKEGAVVPAQMLVVGLIARERLHREAIQLSPRTFVLVGTLVAFGLFAIPFLKLRFIGERERMTARDVWLLAGASLSATALMTLSILEIRAHSRLRERLDSALEAFAGEVIEHLDRETGVALAQLDASALELITEPSASAEPKKPECATPHPLAEHDPVGSILARQTFTSYPNFEALFVTDVCGNQVRKWMPRTLTTEKVKAAPFPYLVPTLTQVDSPGAPNFTFSATVGRASGLLLAILGKPFDAATGQFGPRVAPEKRSGIVAMSTPLHSANAPVVAKPFQFVLVDRDGAVTFQKTRLAFRGERFFDSVVGGGALARAAQTDERRPQTYQYRGRPFRMMALDLPQLQLTLVAFYDSTIIDDLTARVFTTAAVFALGIIASILVGAAVAVAWFGRVAFDWAWPWTKRVPHYCVGIVLCSAAMALLLLARQILSAQALRWSMLVAPLIVLVVLGTGWITAAIHHVIDETPIMRLEPQTPDASWSLMSWAYTAFAVMALVAFVAWPTYIVFKDAFNLHATEFGTEVSHAWSAEVAQFRAADDGLWVRLDEKPESLDCANPTDLRCFTPERVYASEANYLRLRETRDEFAIYHKCADLRHGGSCVVERVPRVPFSITVGVAKWLALMSADHAEHQITLSQFRAQKQPVRAPLWDAFHWSALSLVALLIQLVALGWLVRSIAKHVLGLDVTEIHGPDDGERMTANDGETWLLLRPNQSLVSRLRGQANDRADLRFTKLKKDLRQVEPRRTLLVEHLETHLDEKYRAAALALFDGRHAGCVIVTSDIDPLHYLTQRMWERDHDLHLLPPDDKDKRPKVSDHCEKLRGELACWAFALSHVRKIRQEVPAFPERPAGMDADLYKRLRAECCATAPLVEIGSRLLGWPKLDSCRWYDIVTFVLDAAEPYYRAMWELCSRDERLVLIQLAQVGLVNPKREDVIRRLARRGLVQVDPRYRLMNESFERFVCKAEPPELVSEWERTGSTMSWAVLGTPLYVLAAMAIAVLLFAGQGLFSDVLAVATGSAATLGSLRTLYTSLSKGPAPTKVA